MSGSTGCAGPVSCTGRAPSTRATVHLEAFIDERANEAQRNALVTILTGQAGGTLFEILSQIVTNIHGPHFTRIDWEFDKARRRARLSIPGFLETTTEPLTVPATGNEQRVQVSMPDGFEYKQMDVAQAATLKSTGAIKFDWQGTHSSLAEVEHTQEGLVALRRCSGRKLAPDAGTASPPARAMSWAAGDGVCDALFVIVR